MPCPYGFPDPATRLSDPGLLVETRERGSRGYFAGFRYLSYQARYRCSLSRW